MDDSPGEKRFRVLFAATLAALIGLVGVFGLLAYLQGPKLTTAQIDTTAAISEKGQALRLFANQSVARVRPDQVSIIPATPVTVTTDGATVSVIFTSPLRYNTHYSVKVRSAASLIDARTADLEYSFSTAEPSVYFLKHDPDGDQIVETGIRQIGRTIVTTAAHITAFARAEDVLAFVTDDDGASALHLVNRHGTGPIEDVPLPGRGTVDQLRSDPGTGRVGFLFSSPDHASVLFTVDLTVNRTLTAVAGIDRKPITADSFAFVPNSSSVVALSTDGTLELIDTASAGTATVLGSYTELGGVSSDGTHATAAKRTEWSSIDLTTGTTRVLPLSSVRGRTPIGETAIAIDGGRHIQLVEIWDPSLDKFDDTILIGDTKRSKTLFQTAGNKGTITAFRASPNSQYVAIEQLPNGQTTDVDPAEDPTANTAIIDLATGSLIRGVDGVDIAW